MKIIIAIAHFNLAIDNCYSFLTVPLWNSFIQQNNDLPINWLHVLDGSSQVFAQNVTQDIPFICNQVPYFHQLLNSNKSDIAARLADGLSFYQTLLHICNNSLADYLLRFDADSFISRNCINSLSQYLETHQDISYLTPLNYRSQITPRVFNFSGTKDDLWDETNSEWLPWGLPTPSAGVQIVKIEMIQKALNLYSIYCGSKECPFITNKLSLKEICSLLNVSFDKFPNEVLEIHPVLDGPFQSDIWTMMALAGIKEAAITDIEGKTLNPKMSMNCFRSICNAIQDNKPLLPKVLKNRYVIAPFLHLGASYLTDTFFCKNSSFSLIPQEVINNMFSLSGKLESLSARFCIYYFLYNKYKKIQDIMLSRLSDFLSQGNIKEKDFWDFYALIISNYSKYFYQYILDSKVESFF